MIGQLKGVLVEKAAPDLLIDVHGVGYEVSAPMSTFYKLPETGQSVLLYTHFVVREDAQLLYGFFDRSERALFRALIKVNGVGPKMALTILSGIDGGEFVHSVNNGDTGALVKLPGVGKKTAERLIIEMRDKLADFDAFEGAGKHGKVVGLPALKGARREAESALVALGYKAREANRAITAIDVEGLSSEEMIRKALKSTVR